MSWEQYFEKNKVRTVRPFYAKAIEFVPDFKSENRTAIDLGCGAGVETADLLSRGWNVIAIDREPSSISAVVELASQQSNQKLKTICSSFEDLSEVPFAELIYSYHSLPFCHADKLDRVWSLIRDAVKPNGIFAGSFFGLNDEWVKSGHTTGVSSEKLTQYLSTFDIIHYEEVDKIGNTALSGPKHWHFIEIIGKKRSD
jgi:tellurite methyltransferase